MQKIDEEVKEFLEEKYPNIRETSNGFKINKAQLNGVDIECVNSIKAYASVTIKRSGTGLVIIIEPLV